MKNLLEWKIDLQSRRACPTIGGRPSSPFYRDKNGKILFLHEDMEFYAREHHVQNTKGLDTAQLITKMLLASQRNKGRLKKWKIEDRIIGKLCNCCKGTKVLVMIDRNKKEIINYFPDVIFTAS